MCCLPKWGGARGVDLVGLRPGVVLYDHDHAALLGPLMVAEPDAVSHDDRLGVFVEDGPERRCGLDCPIDVPSSDGTGHLSGEPHPLATPLPSGMEDEIGKPQSPA